MAVSTKPNFFLRRPVLSAVISIVITLVGALAMKALPIAQYPDLVPPTVNVSVSYPGASAETIASTVLAPLEVNINGVENMLYMTSTAASGSGSGNSMEAYVTLYDDKKHTAEEIGDMILEKTADIEKAEITVNSQAFDMSAMGGRMVIIKIIYYT